MLSINVLDNYSIQEATVLLFLLYKHVTPTNKIILAFRAVCYIIFSTLWAKSVGNIFFSIFFIYTRKQG